MKASDFSRFQQICSPVILTEAVAFRVAGATRKWKKDRGVRGVFVARTQDCRYSQYVSLVSRSMVSCFSLLFFFPMFLDRIPFLSYALPLVSPSFPFFDLQTVLPIASHLWLSLRVSYRSQIADRTRFDARTPFSISSDGSSSHARNAVPPIFLNSPRFGKLCRLARPNLRRRCS